MATSLQQQLAAIAANSTHQLDLKAQKTRHSRSLLFEPRDAATQSFDAIFRICYDGYEELCMLDGRFRTFAANIFSEQSKNEDRTQMTIAENEKLDKIIESFLALVSGRLLLKPATKAVEWLVRRFRVQEYNTEYVLLTFLPYHTSHIFPTLLSILPDHLPATFNFLRPYVASLQSPPRHALLAAMINTPQILTVFSNYVLVAAKTKVASSTLLGFWASITAQAVNGILDASQSGRRDIRQQREHDVLTRILPILHSALNIKSSQEMYVASCMIMTIMAAKASLSESVLDAMMEATASAWTESTLHEGLTCLAVMAEEKDSINQSPSVIRALQDNEDIGEALISISQSHRVDKLTTAVILDALEHAQKRNLTRYTKLASTLIDKIPLQDSNYKLIYSKLLRMYSELGGRLEFIELRKTIFDLLSRSVTQPYHNNLIHESAQTVGTLFLEELRSLQLHKQIPEGEARDQAIEALDKGGSTEKISEFLKALPDFADGTVSFLSTSTMNESRLYIAAFDGCVNSPAHTTALLNLKSLKRDESRQSPEFLTFLARAWTGNVLVASKTQALSIATSMIQNITQDAPLDMQALFPYAASGLADGNQSVRRAAVAVCRAISKSYESADLSKITVWMADQFYGPVAEFAVESTVMSKLMHMIPYEDCVLDKDHIHRFLSGIINGDIEAPAVKSSTRHKLCNSLAAHAFHTSALYVKLTLLKILSQCKKIAGGWRVKFLLPIVKEWFRLSETEAIAWCDNECVESSMMNKAIADCISHRSVEELEFLENAVRGNMSTNRGAMPVLFRRIVQIMPRMAADDRCRMADCLLDVALSRKEPGPRDNFASLASTALRDANLPTDVYIHLIESLPPAGERNTQPSPAKRQKVAQQDANTKVQDSSHFQSIMRRITLVLELVEAAHPEQRPELIKSLFILLSELHTYKTILRSELVYTQSLLLNCLNSSFEGAETSGSTDFDSSIIRMDLVVDSIRSTSSPQIYNTGLLLISRVARLKPDLVLHSVMPLFTFMSSTLLKQSDDYSAYVADQTVANIVPPLAASLRKNGGDIVHGAADLLLSFAAAYEHIPLHRRLPLFEQIIRILGSEETLHAIIAVLIAKYYQSDGEIIHFVANLAARFEPVCTLLAAEQSLSLLTDALKPKCRRSNVLLGLDENPDDAENVVETLMKGFAAFERSSLLRKRLAINLSENGENAEVIRTRYAKLLEQTMMFKQSLVDNERLRDIANSLLSAVLGLMPTKDFIESSALLMQVGTDVTRQQVFASLEHRVSHARSGDSTLEQVFIDVLPNCCVFVDETQSVALRSAALQCIDQVCVKFGKRARQQTLDAAAQVAGSAALGSDNNTLRVVSILCLSSMVEVLGEECISIMPKVLTQVLGYLAGQEQPLDLQSAIFTLLCAVLDYVPWILTSKYLDQALTSAANSASLQTDQCVVSAQQFCELAAETVSAAELFASIQRAWSAFKGLTAKIALLKVVRRANQHNTKSTVTKNAPQLFDILLQAYQDWAQNGPELDDYLEEVGMINTIALEMVMKLNDVTFRPFFIRIVTWATDSPSTKGSTYRLLSLYGLAHAIFDELKSVITSYASFLLDSAASVLKVQPSQPVEVALLSQVLQTLSSSFRHDQDDFWQIPTHFEAVATPLLGTIALLDTDTDLLTAEKVTAITDLASAASSPDHLKVINSSLMSFMRHESATVRLRAVKCERSVTEKLNFDWLALLPEMLPFISELQEDDDEDVERETLRWIAQIEEITGESLEGMLA